MNGDMLGLVGYQAQHVPMLSLVPNMGTRLTPITFTGTMLCFLISISGRKIK